MAKKLEAAPEGTVDEAQIEVEQEEFFQVENNIPMPEGRGGAGSKYEWDKLTEVGQSVFLNMKGASSIYASLKNYRKRIKAATGTVLEHTVTKWKQTGGDGVEINGYRVWLITITTPEVVEA